MATDRVGVRFEGRWFGTFLDRNGSLFCANGSCALSASGNVISQYIVNAGLILTFCDREEERAQWYRVTLLHLLR